MTTRIQKLSGSSGKNTTTVLNQKPVGFGRQIAQVPVPPAHIATKRKPAALKGKGELPLKGNDVGFTKEGKGEMPLKVI